MLGPTSWWTQDEVKKMTPYDPARSKPRMAGAGYPNGVDAEYLMYNPNPPTEENNIHDEENGIASQSSRSAQRWAVRPHTSVAASLATLSAIIS